MGNSMRPQHKTGLQVEDRRRISASQFLSVALLGIASSVCAGQMQPQPGGIRPGYPATGAAAAGDPNETAAYSAAVSQPDPAQRVSAIQQFIFNHPNSPMRQAAISQLLMAQRQSSAAPMSPAMQNKALQMQSAPTPAPVPQQVQSAGGIPRESLLSQPSKKAEVTVASHSLAIKADNSALSEILHDISGSTGMKVEGFSKDERVFGSYGPGDAREVLMSLLEGSGYNILMVGSTADGAPRELTLSPRTTTASGAAAPVRANNNNEDEEDVEQEVPQVQTPEPQLPPQAVNPQTGSGGDPSQQQPRTPQEILQELQRIRQQGQSNGAPQPQ